MPWVGSSGSDRCHNLGVQETPAEAITKLIYTYAERIDAGDFAGVGELLQHATLTFEGFGDAVAGREAIEGLYTRTTRRYEDGTPRTKHVMTNVIVDVADDGTAATSRSYFTVLQAVPGSFPLQPVIAGRYRHTYERVEDRWRVAAMHIAIDLTGDLAHHLLFDLRAMKLSLVYEWDCAPEAFWALYFDPEFAVRLHLEALGSTTAVVVSQEGDLSSGLVRTLRYGQRPNMPGPVRKIFGEEVTTTEVTTFDSAASRATFTMTPGTMADKTHMEGAIALTGEGGTAVETFSLEARVKIFGAGPVVERFIEHQARAMQDAAVAFMRPELEH